MSGNSDVTSAARQLVDDREIAVACITVRLLWISPLAFHHADEQGLLSRPAGVFNCPAPPARQGATQIAVGIVGKQLLDRGPRRISRLRLQRVHVQANLAGGRRLDQFGQEVTRIIECRKLDGNIIVRSRYRLKAREVLVSDKSGRILRPIEVTDGGRDTSTGAMTTDTERILQLTAGDIGARGPPSHWGKQGPGDTPGEPRLRLRAVRHGFLFFHFCLAALARDLAYTAIPRTL